MEGSPHPPCPLRWQPPPPLSPAWIGLLGVRSRLGKAARGGGDRVEGSRRLPGFCLEAFGIPHPPCPLERNNQVLMCFNGLFNFALRCFRIATLILERINVAIRGTTVLVFPYFFLPTATRKDHQVLHKKIITWGWRTSCCSFMSSSFHQLLLLTMMMGLMGTEVQQ